MEKDAATQILDIPWASSMKRHTTSNEAASRYFCTVSNLRRGLRAAWLSELAIRKMQKAYNNLVTDHERSMCPAWEVYAQDRKKWKALLPMWEALWLPPDKEPKPTLRYLHDRQLVLLQRPKCLEQMYLRPTRDVLEQPYAGGVLSISELKKESKHAIWLLKDPCTHSCKAVESHKTLCVQVRPPREGALAASLGLLTLGAKLVRLLEHFSRPYVRLAAPLSILKREIFQELAPLHLLPDLSQALLALSCLPQDSLCLQPRKVSEIVQGAVGKISASPDAHKIPCGNSQL